MTKVFAPNLPRPREGCTVCASFLDKHITIGLIDAYVQHHRVAHGWTREIGWQQTFEWLFGTPWKEA